MVKSKNKKSVIALVVMAFLLVASICLAATGAWFTSQIAGAKDEVNFGEITVTLGEGSLAKVVDHGATELTGNVMPGDDVSAKIIVTNAKDECWYAVKLTVTVEGKADASFDGWYVLKDNVVVEASAENMQKLGKTSVTLDKSFTLDGTVYGDDFENKALSVAYEVRAMQAKNVTAAQAFQYLTNATFADNSPLATA